jgi:hypothetical protein
VKNNATIAKEARSPWCQGKVWIRVVGAETRQRGDCAVLAAQVADLTARRVVRIAWWRLASHVRIKMRECRRAIAIGWHGLVVDVVHCEGQPELNSVSALRLTKWAASEFGTIDVDGEGHALAV